MERGKPRVLDRPEPGFYLLTRKGRPAMPARIYWCHTTADPSNPDNVMDRSPFLVGEIGGRVVEPQEIWAQRFTEVSESEFLFRMSERTWLKQYGGPESDPDARGDVRKMKPILPPGVKK